MKLLRGNRILFGLIILVLSSCGDNSASITTFKKGLVVDMITETKMSVDELDRKIERIIITENRRDRIPTRYFNSIISYNSKKDSSYRSIHSTNNFTHQFINNNIKRLLYNVTTYTVGRGKRERKWGIDTSTFDVTTCNPNDTLIVSTTLNRLHYLNAKGVTDTNLLKLTLIQSNHSLFKHWLYRLNGWQTHCWGWGPIQSNLHYTNKVLYKNEPARIIPGLFTFDKSFTNGTYIFKENTSEFIMENGEKKKFTNPIKMKASNITGFHTVKGVITIKKRGELVPKRFEFRYIVE
jgi:hypothetical protein